MNDWTDATVRGIRIAAIVASLGVGLNVAAAHAGGSFQPISSPLDLFAAPAPRSAAPNAPSVDCGATPAGFSAWLEGFKRDVEVAGMPPAVIESALANASYNPDVIAHDRRQGSFGQDFETFAAKRVTGPRVRKGRQMLIAYAEPLETIERRFGVPGPVLVAIWGLETEFGAGLGNYPTFSTLATLAYDCRRSEQFREELADALQLVARGYLQPQEMRGAWAGELGQTQFMPSTYLKYAVGANGGSIADLMNSPEDALASTANFLRSKGWRRGQGYHEGEANYAALLQWNAAPVYAKTIAYFADRLAGDAEPQ